MRLIRPRHALIATMFFAASEAHAEERPRVRLVYEVDLDVVCPTEQRLRTAVGARLGYDPFIAPGAPPSVSTMTVALRIQKSGTGLGGKLEISAGNNTAGARELSSPSRDCEELVSSLAVAIALGVDPASLTDPPDARPSSGTSAPPMTEARPGPRENLPATSVHDPNAKLRVHAGPIVAVGAAPVVNLGLTIGAGARWPTFSLSGEGRADLPAERTAGSGAISTSLLLGTVVPCFHFAIARGCALVTAGTLRSSGESVSSPRQTTNFYAAAGARVGVEVPLSTSVAAGGHADLYGTLTRTTLRLDDRDVWKTPPVSAVFGLDVTGTF